MYQTTISSVNGNMAADINGRSFYIAGSNIVTPGQQVWTDGKVIYGNTISGGDSFIPSLTGGIAWLIPYKEIQIIDKSLGKIKKLCNTKAGYIVYDKKNFNAYIGSHWQGGPAVKDYTILDACYNSDGDLFEIGYAGKPLYTKGYKGKTETFYLFEERSYIQSDPLIVDCRRYTEHYKYQAFYDYLAKTEGTPNFIKLIKNGEIEKSIDSKSIMTALEGDLYNHAAANMGVQDIYKMYESVSLGKSQMTRNTDGGYTCLLSISCSYVAYCVKFRKFKELYYMDENYKCIEDDSHHFAQILASWRVLVTEKGTQTVETSYTISSLGQSWGYLWRKNGDDEDWPEYYTLQPKGYGGDLDADEPQVPQGLSLWFTWKTHMYTIEAPMMVKEGEKPKWVVVQDDYSGGYDKAVQNKRNFIDADFFTPQFKNESKGPYDWRLDHGVITFDDKNTTMEVNGCSFDWWTNTVFYSYPYQKGYLFVVFYLRDSKIKLIYWDGGQQKEVAFCPYAGDYYRAFRVCEVKNTAKIKKLAGVKDG